MSELDLNAFGCQFVVIGNRFQFHDVQVSLKLDFSRLVIFFNVPLNNSLDFLCTAGLLEQYLRMLDGTTYSKEIPITYYIHFVSTC